MLILDHYIVSMNFLVFDNCKIVKYFSIYLHVRFYKQVCLTSVKLFKTEIETHLFCSLICITQ